MAYNKKELQYNAAQGGHRHRTWSSASASWSAWESWDTQLAKSELDGYRFHLRVTRRTNNELKTETASCLFKTGVVTVNTTYSSDRSTFNLAGPDINTKEIWTNQLMNSTYLSDVLCDVQTIVIKAGQNHYNGNGTNLAST